MLRKKRVKLNGGRAEGGEILAEGDRVTLYISPETQAQLAGAGGMGLETSNYELVTGKTFLNVLYEDDEVLVVNKPANCLTHPDLTDEVYKNRRPEAVNLKIRPFRPVAVNRLDRNTTGIVILAKTLPAAQELSRAIRERGLEKLYLAAAAGVIDRPMSLTGMHVKDKSANKAGFGENGKEAVTEIEPLFSDGAVTVLKVTLVTGRSHQIRAHLQSIGRPVIGDPKYGDAAVNRLYREKYGVEAQMLHAWKVRFGGLDRRLGYLNGLEVSCEPDGSLGRILKKLRG
jgi:23S rRNA pseudouridine955/2504/2580 synthase